MFVSWMSRHLGRTDAWQLGLEDCTRIVLKAHWLQVFQATLAMGGGRPLDLAHFTCRIVVPCCVSFAAPLRVEG